MPAPATRYRVPSAGPTGPRSRSRGLRAARAAARAAPVRPPPLFQLDVLMREQHDGNGEAAGGAEHLARGERVGLFFYLNEIGAAVAQQRPERAASVFRFGDFGLAAAHAAGGQGE